MKESDAIAQAIKHGFDADTLVQPLGLKFTFQLIPLPKGKYVETTNQLVASLAKANGNRRTKLKPAPTKLQARSARVRVPVISAFRDNYLRNHGGDEPTPEEVLRHLESAGIKAGLTNSAIDLYVCQSNGPNKLPDSPRLASARRYYQSSRGRITAEKMRKHLRSEGFKFSRSIGNFELRACRGY